MLILVLLLGIVHAAANFYDTNRNIMELDSRNFEKVVLNTNYTTLVEFYAPWCGYCKQLKPTMEQVAKVIDGFVQVVSVNCDLAKNKQLCAKYDVQGFPTLMTFRPPKLGSGGAPTPEVYQGQRNFSPIKKFTLSKMRNYVTNVKLGDQLPKVFAKEQRFAVLFSKVLQVPAAYKAVALGWLDDFKFFSILNTNAKPFVAATDTPRIQEFLNDFIREQRSSDLTKLVIFDTADDRFEVLHTVNLQSMAKALKDFVGHRPNEGPESLREKYLDALKSGKKPTKRNSKRSKPKSRPNAHDEL